MAASSGGRGSATTTGGLKRSNSVTVCQTPKDKEPPEADLEEDEEIERNLRIRGKLKNLSICVSFADFKSHRIIL